MALRYVQTEEHGTWIAVEDGKKFEETAQRMGAVRTTVLSVSDDPDHAEDHNELGYNGPLYFDIDEPRLEDAIPSAQALARKLMELGVTENGLQIYCSGSKGFHIFVPPSLFKQANRLIKRLPAIYKEMARDLYVRGLDFAVYSGGKGRMFRPENGHRPDGKYRVRITLEELFNMTPQFYQGLVSAPRDMSFPGPNGDRAAPLNALYERAKKRLSAKQMERGVAVPDERLAVVSEEPPPCIDMMCAGTVSPTANFNQVAMQVATFVVRAGVPDYKRDSMVAELCDKATSAKYDTVAKRKEHVWSQINYAKSTSRQAFTCAAALSVVPSRPCNDCELKAHSEIDNEIETLGIEARADGYYSISAQGNDRRISTFTLEAVETYMEPDSGTGAIRRVGTQMNILARGQVVASTRFNESGWRNPQEFIKQFEGIAGLSFLGGQVEVQKIKANVYEPSGEDSLEETTVVPSVGVVCSEVGPSNQRRYAYVEPHYSVSMYGIENTYRFEGQAKPAPCLRKEADVMDGDPAVQTALYNLMAMNDPVIMAQLIGWHSLCHIKTQVMQEWKQFPSINLWGEAGAGKTMTSEVMCFLNGVNYKDDGEPVNAALSTEFPIIQYCSSTTTIPRILEEFNRHKMRRGNRWAFATDVVKMAFNGGAIQRGTISRSQNPGQIGAQVKQLLITSPLIICSEQADDTPALIQRMLQLHMSPRKRAGREEYFQALYQGGMFELLRFAKVMMQLSLHVDPAWLHEAHDRCMEYIPPHIVDRPRYSHAMLFVGLEFFRYATETKQLGLTEHVNFLINSFYSYLNDEENKPLSEKRWTEVDTVLQILGEMAALSLTDTNMSAIQALTHFKVFEERRELYLDMRTLIPMYRRYVGQQGMTPVFRNWAHMSSLLRDESYFVEDRPVPEMSKSRMIQVLDMDKMIERGHDVSMFTA